MAKQKCGTCRFFQEAGLAGSGWCHHPQRKVSSDVMIMVRRNELACRDEWSRSLWAPADTSQGDTEPVFHRPKIQGPLTPAGVDELRALAQISERELPPGAGEDVLLSEARIIAEPHERAPLRNSSQGFDVRSAVFRAREAYRERNRARDVAARKSEGATPLPVAELELSAATLEPSASDEHLPVANWQEAIDKLPDFHVDPSLGDEPAVRRDEQRYRPAEPSGAFSASQEGLEVQTSALESFVPPDDSLSWFLSSAPVEIDEAYDSPPQEEVQLRNLYQLTSEPLPAWFRTDLPRTCRTCRDYRPTADGRRGWCANAWAFSHPRLVNEDDAVPCESAFGNWWAAVDDIWLVAADVSNHSRPTPLLDRMVALNAPTKRRSRGTS